MNSVESSLPWSSIVSNSNTDSPQVICLSDHAIKLSISSVALNICVDICIDDHETAALNH